MRMGLRSRVSRPGALVLGSAASTSGYGSHMCRDCPTRKDRVRGAVHELVADLLLPFVLYAIPIALLVFTGYLDLHDLTALVRR